MSNELIEVPDYNLAELRLFKRLDVAITDKNFKEVCPRKEYSTQLIPYWMVYKPVSKTFITERRKLLSFYFRFVWDKGFVEALEKDHAKINLKRFVEFKTQSHSPEKIPADDHRCYSSGFFVSYYNIREPIIAFLEERFPQSKSLPYLKEFFEQNSTKQQDNLEEYLDKKSKYLLELDMEDMVQKMNEETMRKVK